MYEYFLLIYFIYCLPEQQLYLFIFLSISLSIDLYIYIQSAKISLLPSKCKIILLPFKNGNFSNIAIATLDFFYCSPFSYCSANYCDSNNCRSFTLLNMVAKSNGNLFAIAFIAFKSD